MKRIHIVLFGVGNVGSTLIKQILEERQHFEDRSIELNLPVITNSRLAFFEKESLTPSWEADFASYAVPYKVSELINYCKTRDYENLIAVDATASDSFVDNYDLLIKNGFHIVAANKVANSHPFSFYQSLRQTLRENNKKFLYETNVGAGLPIIQTLQGLYLAGEKITKVRGVFSGSLSYIFNTFSQEARPFDEVLREAENKGLTEPDPRMDLSGKDVGRKLLILARELGLKKEFFDIDIQDLVPTELKEPSSLDHFRNHQKNLNSEFSDLKKTLKEGEVLRHVGELDLTKETLEVKLVREKKASPFGNLKNADASFEIYTESYGEQPLVIQGAGAGAAVTARGVLTDLVKLAENFSYESTTQETEQRVSF